MDVERRMAAREMFDIGHLLMRATTTDDVRWPTIAPAPEAGNGLFRCVIDSQHILAPAGRDSAERVGGDPPGYRPGMRLRGRVNTSQIEDRRGSRGRGLAVGGGGLGIAG